ncbi:MAG TPA: MetQ/NlpA family ABC transporter substrate-binding protein [Aliidongia sp.]|uniref:MetQ/NlpA family ABC transporter substrate-binding protein n=1 Tax=Aliidongia sp. TaxID=1914230 RepID=UPI002DDD11F3|nr:MetQ/NlpA family ABC transporter substrate-binding protein [Aliidongia sp.]HEV2675590.1 MetQ/NlpA family ABC transporter substrate-binding protein [Aliidongia sp.]
MSHPVKHRLRLVGLVALLGLSLSVGAAQAAGKIKLGVMAGGEEEVAEVAKKVAAGQGLEVQLVTFQDYALVNAALEAGDLDANAFQHKPYLDAQIAARGYHIVPIGFTIVEPIGLYAKKVKSLDQLPKGAKIGIPNDPSNGGRAINLLAANKLIAVAPGKGLLPSLADVADNPRGFKFIELDAAQLPRSLDDLDAAVINTDYAIGAGLDPRTGSLAIEPRQNNPYGNFIATREKDKDRADLKILVAAYQSKEVAAFLDQRFKGAILPAW